MKFIGRSSYIKAVACWLLMAGLSKEGSILLRNSDVDWSFEENMLFRELEMMSFTKPPTKHPTKSPSHSPTPEPTKE